MSIQRRKLIRLTTVVFSLSAMALFPSFAKEGAKGQFYKDGKPVGPVISLPDCRSCKVQKTGPNSYNVTIPKSARDKMR